MMAAIAATWVKSDPPTPFDLAVTHYHRTVSMLDALPDHVDLPVVNGVAFDDHLVEATCEALDALIERVRAPSFDALAFKMRLARVRCEDVALFDDYWNAFAADLEHLAGTPA